MSTLNNSTVVGVKIGDVSLLDLFQRIWYSLDDIIVCLGVFLITSRCSRALHSCLRVYFETSAYVSQAAHFLLQFVVVVFLVSHLVGMSTAESLFGGFSIGFGYALQPYIVSLVAGGTFIFTRTIRSGDQIQIGEHNMIVDHVGLLYVAAKKDKATTYFPNAMLAQQPFSVLRS